MVDIAQLVEHRIVVPRVVGSSPTIHPKSLKLCRDMAQLVAHSLWERGVVSSSLAIPTIKNNSTFQNSLSAKNSPVTKNERTITALFDPMFF